MELLRKLVEMSGVPGREERVRKLVVEQLTPLVDKITSDSMGNVIGFKKGTNPDGKRKKIMLAGHMDEIGFYVSYIEDSGFLRIQPVGGFDPRTMMSQRVTVMGKRDLPGVIGSKPIHILTDEEKKKQLQIKDYFIDLGMKKEQVDELVKVGDPVTLQRDMTEIGDCLTCKTFDDRVGVYCMIEGVRKAGACPHDLYVVGTTQEEVGLRGALASATGIVPDVGIALDVTLANDVPGADAPSYVSKLGEGTAISLLNGAVITNHKLFDQFVQLAEDNKITYQKDALPRGGTDAGAMRQVPGGAAVITLSIPCRYVHSTVEMVHKEDVQATIDLLAAYINNPGEADYTLSF